MMKSILIVSYFFAPQNAIGAVRPTKLAKYLTRMGYDVTVLCGAGLSPMRDPLLARDLQELRDVNVVQEHSLLRWLKSRKQESRGDTAANSSATTAAPSASAAKSSLRNAVYLWLHARSDAAFAHACIRRLRGMRRHFDIVLSTYGPLSAHTVGGWVKRSGMADKWIADFRDEVTVPFRWQQGKLTRYIRDVRLNADAMTAVSEGFLETMGLSDIGLVISNGFDREDMTALPTIAVDADTLTLTYCGLICKGREITPVFRAVRELIDEGTMDLAHIRFHYAGMQWQEFSAQAASCDLTESTVNHGFLPRSESLALQCSSDALLAAIFNTPQRTGVITGKLLEYMMADRPVICCVSGRKPHSAARALMEQVQLGLCYEQAMETQDAPALKTYLRYLYNARFSQSSSVYRPNAEAMDLYHYPHIAGQFSALMNSL